MFKRMDEILIEIPKVDKPDPNGAAALQSAVRWQIWRNVDA